MSQIGVLKYSYLAHFSQPACDRTIYRSIKKHQPTRIVEVGLGDAVRAQRMLAVASGYHPAAELSYTGVDRFEDGGGDRGAGITLKQAYRLLRQQGAQVRLMPGDSYTALSAIANSVQHVDLMVLAVAPQDDSMELAWPFLPRMLAPQARVFLFDRSTRDGEPSFQSLTVSDVLQRASSRRRAA
jgi:hypothetical protein